MCKIISKIKLLYLGYKQDSLIFRPRGSAMRKPHEYGLDGVEEVFINTKDDISLCLWMYNKPVDENHPFVILFHGNTGHWGDVGKPKRQENYNPQYRLELLKELIKHNIGFCALSIRGFGNSNGEPSEKGFEKDIETISEYVLNDKNIDNKNLVILGESLGSAIGFMCCEHLTQIEKPPAMLVSVAAFSTMKDKIIEFHPDLKDMDIDSKLRHDFDSMERMNNISQSIKLRFMHPEFDETTNISHSKNLYAVAQDKGFNADFIVLKDAGHISWNAEDVVSCIISEDVAK